jgi:hypothetical protein
MTAYYVTTTGNDGNAGTSEGAAFASPGKGCATAGNGDVLYIKSGTYTLTTSTQNANAGPMLVADGVTVEGYLTTPGDLAAKPVVDAGAITSITICQLAAANFNSSSNTVKSLSVDGKSNSSVNGFVASGVYTSTLYDCEAKNCVRGFNNDAIGLGTCLQCVAINCSAYGFYKGLLSGCWADQCDVGFLLDGSGARGITSSIASNSTGDGFKGNAAYNMGLVYCISYNNGGDGFSNTYDIMHLVGCVAVGNTSYGFSIGNTNAAPVLLHCADYNNSSRSLSANVTRDINPINLTADPFVDAANDDFTLNTASGGGAVLRSNSFTIGSTSLYPFRNWVVDSFGGGSSSGVRNPFRGPIG